MHDAASAVLTAWSNFYVITGSAAAALTGLMFIVITLVAGDRSATTHEGIATFSTPTVVHFCAALLVSVILSAPWHMLAYPAALVGLTGLYGVVYVLRVVRWTRRLTGYDPETEDWIWYAILPLAAYVTIVATAIALPRFQREALFPLAGATVLMIFIGIHNAWDVVTFIAIDKRQAPPGPNDEQR